jgi:hypothetical protein
MNGIKYGWPGAGAIEYACEQVNGMSREQAAPIIKRSLTYDMPDDPRIKRCIGCGYPFRDKTRPGNAKTCGEDCAKAKNAVKRKVSRRQIQRISVDYVWWLEYPYYVSEWKMLSKSSRERSFSPEKMAAIIAARQAAGKI